MHALLRSLLQSLPASFILQGIQHQQPLTSPVLLPADIWASLTPRSQPSSLFSQKNTPRELPSLTHLLQTMQFVEVALPELQVGNSHRDLGKESGMSPSEGELLLLPGPSLLPKLAAFPKSGIAQAGPHHFGVESPDGRADCQQLCNLPFLLLQVELSEPGLEQLSRACLRQG